VLPAAPAAPGAIRGAWGLDPTWRGTLDLDEVGPRKVTPRLLQSDQSGFAGQAARHEHHPPVGQVAECLAAERGIGQCNFDRFAQVRAQLARLAPTCR